MPVTVDLSTGATPVGEVVVKMDLRTLDRIERQSGSGVYDLARRFSEDALRVPEDVARLTESWRARAAAGDDEARHEQDPTTAWLLTDEGRQAYEDWLRQRSVSGEIAWVSWCTGQPADVVAENLPVRDLFAVGRQLRAAFFEALNQMQGAGKEPEARPTSPG